MFFGFVFGFVFGLATGFVSALCRKVLIKAKTEVMQTLNKELKDL